MIQRLPPAAARGTHLNEILPRHWTPSDPNGARRWGLSFGAGLLLFVVVGLFGVYMAIDEHEDEDAWNRVDLGRTHRLLAPASGVSAQVGSTEPPPSADLVPLLEAQIASANADGAADAVRMRRTSPPQKLAREPHRTTSAEHTAAVSKPVAASSTPAAAVSAPVATASTTAPPAAKRHATQRRVHPANTKIAAASVYAAETASAPATAAAAVPATPTPAATATNVAPGTASLTRPTERARARAASETETETAPAAAPKPMANAEDFVHPPLLRAPPSDTAATSATHESPPRSSVEASSAETRTPPSSEAAAPRDRAPAILCEPENAERGCTPAGETQPALAPPHDSTHDATQSEGRSAPIEHTASTAVGDAEASTSSASTKPPSVARTLKPRSLSPGAQTANIRHAHSPIVHHPAPTRHRHAVRAAASRPSTFLFTLPRSLTAPLRLPAFPHPSSLSFDLSANQRELYRGH
ncbi:hypothetical protein [Trinickia acidisoli]|uniref:hypothetical protein n=1 Tax=Trinickia acidisoli TaxID=2767482 RepID=UPI001A8E2C39|nr:hypothetical protein [Trinickia acidisoli]